MEVASLLMTAVGIAILAHVSIVTYRQYSLNKTSQGIRGMDLGIRQWAENRYVVFGLQKSVLMVSHKKHL